MLRLFILIVAILYVGNHPEVISDGLRAAANVWEQSEIKQSVKDKFQGINENIVNAVNKPFYGDSNSR